MSERMAFYVKCRPQNADIIDLVLRTKRVFIGYPAWIKGKRFDAHNIHSCMQDISLNDEEWNPKILDSNNYHAQVSHNRKIAESVQKGDFVLVPRLDKGIIFLGRIKTKFELINDPPWAEEYMKIRQSQGLPSSDSRSHVGDVVQTWEVDTFKPVLFPYMPRWISYSLLSQRTLGRVFNRPDGSCRAADVLNDMYNGSWQPDLTPTVDINKVESRLLDWLSPNMLEHMVCSLLQLKYPDWRWFHTGGTGDCGTDIMAVDLSNELKAVVQCKWKTSESPVQIGANLKRQLEQHWDKPVDVFVATIYNNAYHGKEGPIKILNRKTLAELIIKYRNECNIVKSLGLV